MPDTIDQSAQPNSREAILEQFNKSIGLNSVSNPIPNYNPRPDAIDNYRQVVGNPVTGSNPQSNNIKLEDLNSAIASTRDFNNNLMEVANKKAQLALDPHDQMKPYTYNGDFDGANFEHYYNTPQYNKLGFSPYRNNEALYNDNMTMGDEFVRAAGQWPSLIATGFKSGIRSWGTMFTDPLAPDLKSSREMARAMAIGSATKEGAGSFFINTALNSGYTLGIGVDMLGESLALAGATALTGGLDAEVTLPAWMTRMTSAVKMGSNAAAAAEKLKESENIMEGVSSLRNFWNNNKLGKALATAGGVINPLENTWEVGKDIVRGKDALKYTNTATGTINRFAQASKNFGAFAQDMIQIKAAVSEAQLEGGSAQIDVTKDLINKFRAENNGLDPEGEDLIKIETIAKQEAHRVALWNLPAISWSNKFMYETLFAPIDKTVKKGLGNIAEDIFFKETKDKAGKVVGKFASYEEGLIGRYQKVKDVLSKPENFAKFGYNYLKENAAEGVQENIQDAISIGARSHALATYSNPDRGVYEGYMGHFLTGLNQQFSAQGAETFAGGFVIGAIAHPFMAGAHWAGAGIVNNTLNREQFNKYKNERKVKIEEDIKTLNELYSDPMKYFAPDLANAIKQGVLQKDFHQANLEGNRKKAEDAKSNAVYEHLYTALRTGKYDIFTNQIKKLQELDPEAAKEAFKVEDGEKALNMLNDVLTRAESIKKNYEEVSSSYPNPFDPYQHPKDSPEYKDQAMAYMGWEDAKKEFVFARTEFENHSKRIDQVVNSLIGKKNPLKNADAQDLMVLMDPKQMAVTKASLRLDIKSTDASTAEGRKIITEKAKKLELLEALSEGFKKWDSSSLGATVADKKFAHQEVKKVFNKYINHIAKTSGDFVFDTELDDALELIKDNYTLRDERASLVKSINVLSNPKGFLKLQKSLVQVLNEINANKAEDILKHVDKFADNDVINTGINELFAKAKVVLTPEYASYLREAIDKNQTPESPKSFIDPKTKKEISDPKDPMFIKALELWNNVLELLEKPRPKVVTKESLEAERDAKLEALKINILSLPGQGTFYGIDGTKYIVNLRGGDLESTKVEIDDGTPFSTGEEVAASTVGQGYKENPVPIIEDYAKKIIALNPPKVSTGKVIYATKGSGKSTFVQKHPEDYIDADDLLVAEIKKRGVTIPAGENPQETIRKWMFSERPLSDKESIYEAVRKQFPVLKAMGKTILTGSDRFIKDADSVFKSSDDSKTGLAGEELKGFRQREQAAIDAAGKVAIPLTGYIGEKLSIPEPVKQVESPVDTEKEKQLRATNIDSIINRIITLSEKSDLLDKEITPLKDAISNLESLLNNSIDLSSQTLDSIQAQLNILLADTLHKPGSMKKGRVADLRAPLVDSLKASYRSHLTVLNDITDKIKYLHEEVAQQELIKKDLEKQIDYYTNLISDPTLNTLSRTELEARLNKIESKVKTITRLLDILKDAIRKSVAYIREYVAEVFKSDKAVKSFADKTKYRELSRKELNKLVNSSLEEDKVFLENYADLKAEYEKLENTLLSNMDTVEMLEESKAAEIERRTALNDTLLKYNDQIRYLKELLSTTAEELKPVGSIKTETTNAPALEVKSQENKAEVKNQTEEAITKKEVIIEEKPVVETTDIEAKKADIERRRQEALLKTESTGMMQVTLAKPGWYAKIDDFGKIKGEVRGWASENGTLEHIIADNFDEYKKKINAKYDKELAALEDKTTGPQAEFSTFPEEAIISNIGKVKGKKVVFRNLPGSEMTGLNYFVYKTKKGLYVITSDLSMNEGQYIADSEISEEDAIQKAYEYILNQQNKNKEEVEQVDLTEQYAKIKAIKTFTQYDQVFDEVIQALSLQPMSVIDKVADAFGKQLKKLFTRITINNLNSARKKGYKIVVDGKIYANFTVNKKDKSVSLKTPMGGTEREVPMSDIKEITKRDMITEPVTVTPETKEQIKEIVSTGSDIASDEDFQKANSRANTDTTENITKDFMDNLGCK